MKSISFDNPLLLLVAIPLLLAVVIPYIIAVRRDNRSVSTVTSFIIHICMTLVVTLAMAGTVYTSVITRTEVIVVADMSDSNKERADEIDGYITELEESLIGNSSLGIVTFGRDYELLVGFDEPRRSVRHTAVDGSATDIASALEYAGGLFSENSLKRIVLLTDARQTDARQDTALIRTVDNLFATDVQIDAIYLDNNLTEDREEVQVSAVDFTESTYRGHEAEAELLLMSNYSGRCIITLVQDEKELEVRTVNLTPGFNLESFTLPTDKDGVFNYTVSVNAESDSNMSNNRLSFSQSVSGELSVLLITSHSSDEAAARAMYGENATIDVYNINKKDGNRVPYTVEALARYDEILISEVDVRELVNYGSFVTSLDKVVSLFGKSLVTFGNNNIQNKTDDILDNLQNMLPVSFGNDERDAKLMTILLDMSRSMELAYRMKIAKDAAKSLLNILEDDDRVAIIAFWGEQYTVCLPTPASERDELAKKIDGLSPYQGTLIGSAMDRAYEFMVDLDYSDKEVVLISDGLSYIKQSEDDGAIATARNMLASGITVSTINVFSKETDAVSMMSGIAEAGGGNYYYIESAESFEEQFSSQIADDLTETVVEADSEVHIKRRSDATVDGLVALPNVKGFVIGKAKNNATVVLTVDYIKASGGRAEVPLYAYSDYGNGRVSVFTSALSGAWVEGWVDNDGSTFLSNVATESIPRERIDVPFDFKVHSEGGSALAELIPATLKADAVALLTLTSPSGTTEELM
ncbi:MAG: VWA domain-containing protein, partial [Clostridia bacterium]|nr:VWA domain-containing protein [Clostridia bacterium]